MYEKLSKPHGNLRGVVRQCYVGDILLQRKLNVAGLLETYWLCQVWDKKS